MHSSNSTSSSSTSASSSSAKNAPMDTALALAEALITELSFPYPPSEREKKELVGKLCDTVPFRTDLIFQMNTSSNPRITKTSRRTIGDAEVFEEIDRLFCMIYNEFSLILGANAGYAFQFSEIKKNQERFITWLNDPANKQLVDYFLAMPGVDDFFRTDPADRIIKGTAYFYKACYNDISNVWLLCHASNMGKSEGNPLDWFPLQYPYFWKEFVKGIETEGLLQGIFILRVGGVKVESLTVGNKQVNIHVGGISLGKYIRSWFQKRHNRDEHQDIRKFYYESFNIIQKKLAELKSITNHKMKLKKIENILKKANVLSEFLFKQPLKNQLEHYGNESNSSQRKEEKYKNESLGTQIRRIIKIVEISPENLHYINQKIIQELNKDPLPPADELKEKVRAWVKEVGPQPSQEEYKTKLQELAQRANVEDKGRLDEARKRSAAEKAYQQEMKVRQQSEIRANELVQRLNRSSDENELEVPYEVFSSTSITSQRSQKQKLNNQYGLHWDITPKVSIDNSNQNPSYLARRKEEKYVAKIMNTFMKTREVSLLQDLRDGCSEEDVNQRREEYREDFLPYAKRMYKNQYEADRVCVMLEADYPKEMVGKIVHRILLTELTANEMANIVLKVQKLVERQPKLSVEEMNANLDELVNYNGMTRKELDECIEATERLADKNARAHQEELTARQEMEILYEAEVKKRVVAEARLIELEKAYEEVKKRPAEILEHSQEPAKRSKGSQWMRFSRSVTESSKKQRTSSTTDSTNILSLGRK